MCRGRLGGLIPDAEFIVPRIANSLQPDSSTFSAPLLGVFARGKSHHRLTHGTALATDDDGLARRVVHLQVNLRLNVKKSEVRLLPRDQ